jgi:hypothetical protein
MRPVSPGRAGVSGRVVNPGHVPAGAPRNLTEHRTGDHGVVLASPSRMSFVRLIVLLPVLAGCVGNVQRSARVPHPAVPLRSGQPLDTAAQLSAGLSNVTDAVEPAVGDDTQAVEVPATQMRDELRFRLGSRAELALVYEHGFGSTSRRPDATQAPVGQGDVYGYGIAAGYSFETSTPGLSVGTTFELIGWSVPYVEYQTCNDCEMTTVDHGRARPATLGLGITPSYRSGRVTWFGGAFARNHPTTLRKEMNTDVFDGDGDVRNGPFNLLLHLGVEIMLERRLSALVVAHQNLVANPVRYGPGVGIALAVRLGN